MGNSAYRTHRPLAFTLVELLAVVSIIAILVAILLPVVNRAREQAKMITCASSMRVIGQAVRTFANDNGGRGPGGGEHTSPTSSSHSWVNILDAEVFARPGSSYAMVRMAGNTSDVQAGVVSNVHTLNCPNFVARTDYRPFGLNYDLTLAGNGLVQNPYARIADYNAKGVAETYQGVGCSYHLGAMLTRFNPTEVLLVEKDGSNDDAPNITSTVKVVLGRDASPPTNPGYVGGGLSFRHPYFERANFLLFDGSIQTWRPTDGVLNVNLYAIH